MIKYNLCYIRQGDKILLLNRERPGWMGCWNGVGGKLEANEEPRVSMLREALEETNIGNLDLRFKGLITWSTSNGTGFGGLYLYIAYLPEDYAYPTLQQTDEGILQWKDIDWILHPDNLGVAYNLPNTLRLAFNDERCFDHHSVFSSNHIFKETHTEIDPSLETNSVKLQQYLEKYLQIAKKA